MMSLKQVISALGGKIRNFYYSNVFSRMNLNEIAVIVRFSSNHPGIPKIRMYFSKNNLI
jgi:hypothetical protein